MNVCVCVCVLLVNILGIYIIHIIYLVVVRECLAYIEDFYERKTTSTDLSRLIIAVIKGQMSIH